MTAAIPDERLAQIRQRINRAHTELGDVCAQGPSRRFRMHIPADPERDTDLIISAALGDAERLADEVEHLRAALARVQDRMLMGEAWAHRELSNEPQARDHVLAVIADLRIALDGVGAASGLLLQGGT